MVAQLLELGARERHHQVLRNPVHRHDVGQVDLGRSRRRQLDLGLLGRLLQTLHRHRVLTQVDAVLGLERLGHVVDQHVVEVVAAQMRVAVGRLHLEDAVAQFQNRNIERTAAQVVNGDLHVGALLVQAVGQCRRRRLVDDTAHFQPCDFARLLRRLTLRVGEVGRHGDDRFVNGLPQIVFGRLLHLLENDGRNLLRAVLTSVDLHARRVVRALDDLVGRALDLRAHLIVCLAHETLDREDRAHGVGNGLTLGRIAHLPFAALGECDHRRSGAVTFRIGDNDRFVTLHNRYARVRSTQINTDNLSHNLKLLFRFQFYSFCPVSRRSRHVPRNEQRLYQTDFRTEISGRPRRSLPKTHLRLTKWRSRGRLPTAGMTVRTPNPHRPQNREKLRRPHAGHRSFRRRISLRPPALRRRRRLQTETGAAEFRKKWSFSEIYARILPPEFVKFKLIP